MDDDFVRGVWIGIAAVAIVWLAIAASALMKLAVAAQFAAAACH